MLSSERTFLNGPGAVGRGSGMRRLTIRLCSAAADGAYGDPVGGETARLMVGRDRELARVTGLLDDALAGQGRLVLCTGEAGIGKTRLAEEAAAAAAARGMPAVWARAADRGSSPPYGLWRLALDEPVIRGDGEGGSRPDLWAQVLGDTQRPPLAEGADSGSASRFALFAQIAAWSSEGPDTDARPGRG